MAGSDDRAIVANEITILLRQLEQVSNLLSSQTRDLGGIDADIKSLNRAIDDIKKNITELFNSRNKLDKECPVLRGKIEAKIRDANDAISDIQKRTKSVSDLESKVTGLDTRLSSIEGYIKNELEEKAKKEEENKKDKRTLKSMLWDATKLVIQAAIAAGIAYATIKFGKS